MTAIMASAHFQIVKVRVGIIVGMIELLQRPCQKKSQVCRGIYANDAAAKFAGRQKWESGFERL